MHDKLHISVNMLCCEMILIHGYHKTADKPQSTADVIVGGIALFSVV